MNRGLYIACLILLTTFCSFGQVRKVDPLVLSGTIVDLNTVAECSGTDGRILVQVELAMQFRNDGDRPAIVFKLQTGWADYNGEVGSTSVNFFKAFPSSTDNESERIQVNDIRKTSCYPHSSSSLHNNSDLVAAFVKRIDFATPSSEFVIIEPRGYYQFRQIVTVDTGYDVGVKIGKSLTEARIRSEFPALQLEYRLSLKEKAKDEEILRTLKSRWKSIGNLVLDGSGNFAVTSEPIINRNSE